MPQTSYLKFKKHNLIIHDNGYYEDPLTYHLDGYFGWSTKAAELMPLEYQPNKQARYEEITEDFEKEEATTNQENSTKMDSLRSRPSNSEFSLIEGMVIDEVTHEPISNATVFFSNTLLHAKADAHGKYSLKGIPNGMYDVVVAAPNYDFVKSTIELNSREETLNWQLKGLVVKAQESVGQSAGALRIFEFFFNGRTQNSKKCTIKNSEALNFMTDKVSNVMKVYAQQPLEIENKATGYLITCYLKEFTYDLSKRKYTVDGASFIKELQPSSKKQLKVWKRARQIAYEGSFPHFMESLYKRTLKENNFLMYSLVNSQEIPVNEDYIFSDRPDTPLKIKVVYLAEPQQYTYDFKTVITPVQTSYLTLTKQLLRHYPNRYLSHPSKYELKGYMSWSSVFAEMVPLDYFTGN